MVRDRHTAAGADPGILKGGGIRWNFLQKRGVRPLTRGKSSQKGGVEDPLDTLPPLNLPHCRGGYRNSFQDGCISILNVL